MNIITKELTFDYKKLSNPKKYPSSFMKHSHNLYEIIFFESGDAKYVVEEKKYTLKKDDLIFTRPLQYHYIEIESNAEYTRYDITFDNSIIDEELISLIPNNIDVINCSNDSIIKENFNRINYYSHNLNQTQFLDILKSLLKEIIYNISLTKNDIITIPSFISKSIKDALDYINKNLFTIKSIQEISNVVYLSETYFFKLFKQELKISPKKYINLKRLHYAQKAIQLGKKPSSIYSYFGFDSYIGFYKQYIKIFGHSPSQESIINN